MNCRIAETKTVMFGFPVDIATSLSTPNGFDYVLSNSLRQFQIKDGDHTIAVQKTIDQPLYENERPPGIERNVKLIRRWSLAPIHFARDEHKRLHVSYIVRCVARDEGFKATLTGNLADGSSATRLDLQRLGEMGVFESSTSP